MAIPIIDLFAGPGGLGEGFTSILDNKGNRIFRIALSIEKDEFAHKTLTLRSFLRQFPHRKLPLEYYAFLQGKLKGVDDLFALYTEEAKHAKEEAWMFELGKAESHKLIDKRIRTALAGADQFALIGGPPCQAYSLVGRARRQEGDGLNKEDVRVYLYREYYRILAEHKPQVFIMENVKGLLSSQVESKMIFEQLISDLRNPVDSYKKLRGEVNIPKSRTQYKIYSLVKKPLGHTQNGQPIFNPSDFIIRSEEYGIPQTRHRVILLGIRQDLNITPEALVKQDAVPISMALNDLPRLRSGLSKEVDGKENWKNAVKSILQSSAKKQISDEVWQEIVSTVDLLKMPQNDRGDNFIDYNLNPTLYRNWYYDENLQGVLNHETRSHIREDLHRYLFAACFAKVNKSSPKLSDFPASLLPNHENVEAGITENKFADRFRVQLATQPSKTITSHISKDGHYYIHPDESQCRSLTVREAARIQTFPDNYYFCGPRTEQFHQVGNAVPPLLAAQIAKIVQKLF